MPGKLMFLMLLFAGLGGPAQAGAHTLLVPARTLYPGEAVDEAVLTAKTFNLAGSLLRNWVSEPGQAAGRVARRTLVAGKPIALSALKSPDAVIRGRPVRAHFLASGIEISTLLVPLGDAPAGAMVSARNPQTGMVIEALVQANGELLVSAP